MKNRKNKPSKNKENPQKCTICQMYPKLEDDNRCRGCKAIQDGWVEEAKKAGLTLGDYLIRSSKWH